MLLVVNTKLTFDLTTNYLFNRTDEFSWVIFAFRGIISISYRFNKIGQEALYGCTISLKYKRQTDETLD